MKRVPENNPATSSLPTFLDEPVAAHGVETTEQESAAGSEIDEELTFQDEPEAVEGESPAEQPIDEEVADDEAQASDDPPATRRVRKALPARSGGTLAMAIGGCLAIFGAVASLLPSLASALPPMLEGPSLLVIGAVVFTSGASRRRLGSLEHQLQSVEAERRAQDELLREHLQFLVDAQGDRDAAPAAGEELQHVLLSLQRQDAKINNLTKALKAYGKPLLDIAGQGTELAGNVAQVRALVEGGSESTRQAVGRIETHLRAPIQAAPELGQLATNLQRLAAEVHALTQKAGPTLEPLQQTTGRLEVAIAAIAQRLEKSGPTLEPLQQQTGRLEVAVAAIAQRLENSEVQKSLMRLEDATQKAQQEVKTLSRGDVVREVATQLQKRFDTATTQLADGLNKLREGNLGGLEVSVKEIQREVSGLATSVAQIQAAVRAGLRAAPAAAANQAPTPAPAARPEATAAPAPAGASSGGAAAGGYQTGTRTTGSKNVLGAIAKLKQMKN